MDATVDAALTPKDETPARGRFLKSPIAKRRWRTFKANRRGFWSLWIFAVFLFVTAIAEFVANERPIIAVYKGELLFPALIEYPESKFGGFLATTNYSDAFIQREIEENGWMVWAPIRYSHDTVNAFDPVAAPAPPWWTMSREELCARYPAGVDDPNCSIGNFHWLGTDNNGRDVVANVLYGFRLAVAFGFTLSIISSIIGIIIGAASGYYGGWFDLLFQRFMEIWGSVPTLYVLIIVFSIIAPSFWIILFVLLLFSWMGLVGLVRAEFLRARNFEYVNAARALGVANSKIMFKHLLPNAMVTTLTFVPFILAGSIGTLAGLDFLGFGMPPGSPSLGAMLATGKELAVSAPWLGLTGFFITAFSLVLLIFIGEAIRDAFDPRKTFGAAR